MTIKETENFYKLDKKEYNLTSKNLILNWISDIIEKEKLKLKDIKYPENSIYALKNTIKGIYKSIEDINELQELIDFLTIWYEIKYPNSFFEAFNNTSYKLTSAMNFEELLQRLDNNKKDFILCNYRANGWSATPILINGRAISDDSIFMSIDIKRNINDLNNDYSISINADAKTGLLNTKYTRLMNLINKKYIQKGYMTLEELYNELEKSENNINYIALKETILDKRFREKIRETLLEMTILKLIYSKHTIPEYGYERAKKLINEFNRNLNINLKTNRVDEIINKDYSDIKKLKKVSKIDIT